MGYSHKDMLNSAVGVCSRKHHALSRENAEVTRQQVRRKVDQLLRVVFNVRRRKGRLDLEAVEMVVSLGLRQAGAAARSELLKLSAIFRSSADPQTARPTTFLPRRATVDRSQRM